MHVVISVKSRALCGLTSDFSMQHLLRDILGRVFFFKFAATCLCDEEAFGARTRFQSILSDYDVKLWLEYLKLLRFEASRLVKYLTTTTVVLEKTYFASTVFRRAA